MWCGSLVNTIAIGQRHGYHRGVDDVAGAVEEPPELYLTTGITPGLGHDDGGNEQVAPLFQRVPRVPRERERPVLGLPVHTPA